MTPRDVVATPHGFIALGFGSGLAPIAPGTAGSLVALPLMFLIKPLPWWGVLIVLAAAFLLGLWACQRAGDDLGVTDHGSIVWDEFIGMWITLLLVPLNGFTLLVGFFAFRFFDIVKPWPVRTLERRLGGALGVIVDDMAAGIYALLATTAIWRFAAPWVA